MPTTTDALPCQLNPAIPAFWLQPLPAQLQPGGGYISPSEDREREYDPDDEPAPRDYVLDRYANW